ncbi:hypothetical protein AVBRAN12654_03245 [Campylobacter sp. RM12654]|uniref:hypothetical protein n=1 Tax=Campylobacter sp. RM12654 TaxID=2735738 RepID=UPI0030151203|nr:hypothetical protein [Campylobacter sp. RM12654]
MEILNKLFMDFFNKIGDVIINNIFKVLSVFAVFIALIPFLTYYLINLHYIPKIEWFDIVSYLLCSFVIVFFGVLIFYLYFEAIYSVLEYRIKQKIDYIFKFYLLTTMIILPMLLIVVVFFDKDDAFVLFLICVSTYMFTYIMKNSKVFIRYIFIFTSILIFACTNVKIVQILGIGDYYADVELDSNYVKTKIILSKLDDSQIDKTYIEDNKVIVKNIKVLNSAGDELLLQVESKNKTIKHKPLRFNKKYADIL